MEAAYKINKYKEGTDEHMMFDYFKKMQVYLDQEQVNDVVSKIRIAAKENKYFTTLDELEEKYGAKKENYKNDVSAEFRKDRELAQSLNVRLANGGFTSKRRVMQLDLDGNYITTFNSLMDASWAISGSKTKHVGGISNCANGRSFQSCGFIWEFIDDYSDWEE